MNVGRDNAVGIGKQCADFNFIAFLYQDFGRSADMLLDGNINIFRKSGFANRRIGGDFKFVGVNTADRESLFATHSLSSTEHLVQTMAPVGQFLTSSAPNSSAETEDGI